MTRSSSCGSGGSCFTSSAVPPVPKIRYHRLHEDDNDESSVAAGPGPATAPRLHGLKNGLDARNLLRSQARLPLDPSADPTTVSAAESTRVLRLIDRALLPPMMAIYLLQTLDKATLSYASLFGLIEGAHLHGSQYSSLASVVFLAQLLVQLPLTLVLVKLPVGKFTSLMVLLWGLALASMAAAHSFRTLLIARFFLGSFEAVIGPAFIAITTMWWRRREQTLRTSIWYAMNGATWLLGSILTYGLGQVHTRLAPYQLIFVVFGFTTVLVAFFVGYWLPDSPAQARFLSEHDKLIAIERLPDSQSGHLSREWRQLQFVEAFWDAKTWLWFSMIFAISVPSNGIAVFGPLIASTFLTSSNATLVHVPVGILNIGFICGGAFLAMKIKKKGPVIALLCLLSATGFLVFLLVPHTPDFRAVLLPAYLLIGSYTSITPLLYSWSAQNTAGDTKKKTISSLVFIGSSAGNVVGPFLYSPEEAPAFARGLRLNFAAFILLLGLVAVTTGHLKRLNRSHSRRRVALGKAATVLDTSLLSAKEEADLVASQPMDDDDDVAADAADTITDAEDEVIGDERSVVRPRAVVAFADATDLENEDFVFVI